MNFKKFRTSKPLLEGARIQHAEDIILWEGSSGAKRVLESLKGMAGNLIKNVSIKFDGSPALIFGRDEDGNFIFTDKSGFTAKGYDGRSKSPEELKEMLLNRSGGKNRENESYVEFANRMASIFPLYEQAVPSSFRGYFKGDLLYFSTPPLRNGYFTFTPNVVTYEVRKESELGQQIAKSKSAIVIHRVIDESGGEHPLTNPDIFQGTDVLVLKPVFVSEPVKDVSSDIKEVENLINNQSQIIDSFFDESKLRQLKISDLPNIFYSYINSKVDTGLDNLGKDFTQWIETKNLSANKKSNVLTYIKENQKAFETTWKIISTLMYIKDDIIEKFDNQSVDIKQRVGDSPGGEGYVLADPKGDIKLVPRRRFSAANRALRRESFNQLYKSIITEQTGKTAVIAYGRLNPPTIGHQKLVNTILKKASEVGGDAYLFLSHTQKPKTDPLSLKEKIKFVSLAFPNIEIGNKVFGGEFTPPLALEALYKAGYNNIYLIVGSDRLATFQFIKNYNNIPDKSGKILYAFDKLEILSAGERDPDADGVEGMSASKMRQAVVDGDFDLFLSGSPLPTKNQTKQMYEAVKQGMGVK